MTPREALDKMFSHAINGALEFDVNCDEVYEQYDILESLIKNAEAVELVEEDEDVDYYLGTICE